MKYSRLFAFLMGANSFRFYNDDPNTPGGNSTPPAQSARREPEAFSREYVQELREESRTWRTKAADLERTHGEQATRIAAAEKERDERIAAAETRANSRIINAELRAVAAKFGMVDLDGIKLLDSSQLKLTEDGAVEGAEALIEAAQKAKPWLFGGEANSSSNSSRTPPPNKGEKKSARDMTDDEWQREKRKLGLR